MGNLPLIPIFGRALCWPKSSASRQPPKWESAHTQLWVKLKSPVYTQNQRFTQSVLADYKKEVIALKKRLGLWKGQHVCFLSLVRRNLFLAPDRQTRVCRRVSACKTGLRNSWTAGAQLGIILIPRLLVSWLCLVFVPCRVNFKACKRNCSRGHLEKYIWWKVLLLD